MGLKNVAIMYDFDGTLAKGNIQEYNFIPALNMTSSSFWKEVSNLSKENEMDTILAYMYVMLKKADLANISIKKSAFLEYGKNISFYEGINTWFDRINEYGKALGLNIHHYVISSGIKEMIEGTEIADKFDKIYACSYMYNVDNIAKWPAVCVNYTNKTQFLFRINKGVLDVYDPKVNDYMTEDERYIHFSNMIYLGDGETDIPCMKLVKNFGGNSIAVYDNMERKKVAEKMFKENRINFYSEADYRENEKLDKYIKGLLVNIAKNSEEKSEVK